MDRKIKPFLRGYFSKFKPFRELVFSSFHRSLVNKFLVAIRRGIDAYMKPYAAYKKISFQLT